MHLYRNRISLNRFKHELTFLALGLCTFASAQITDTSRILQRQDTNALALFDLFESSSTKMLGKAVAYRLTGTRTQPNVAFTDSTRVYYSGKRGSVPVSPTFNRGYLMDLLETQPPIYTTYYDSSIDYLRTLNDLGQWVWKPKKSFYHLFNSRGQLIERGQDQGTPLRHLYTYDSADRIVSIVDEKYVNGAWQYKSKSNYAYNYRGYINYLIDINQDTAYKYETSLYPNGLPDSVVLYYINAGVWSPASGIAYDYDSVGRETRYVNYTYDSGTQGFVVQSSRVSTYAAQGAPKELITYQGKVGHRINYYYSGQLLDSMKDFSWDTTNSGWVPSEISVFFYSSGLLVKKETSDIVDSVVHSVYKIEFATDANQNVTIASISLRSFNGPWYTWVEIVYYYEEYEGPGVGFDEMEESTLNVYPNPGNGNFKLNLPFEGAGQFEVYGLDGRKVYATELHGTAGEVMEFNLNAPAGVYLFKLQEEGQKSRSGKIVVQ